MQTATLSARIADHPAAKPRIGPLDAHIGRKIRERRLMLGMTKEKLAEAMGLTFQQIQKYEYGANRLAAARLPDLCEALQVSVHYFFGEVTPLPSAPAPQLDRDLLDAMRCLRSIPSPGVKQRVLQLIRELAREAEAES